MNRERRFQLWSRASLGIVCALVVLPLAHASDHRGTFTEEFHQT